MTRLVSHPLQEMNGLLMMVLAFGQVLSLLCLNVCVTCVFLVKDENYSWHRTVDVNCRRCCVQY